MSYYGLSLVHAQRENKVSLLISTLTLLGQVPTLISFNFSYFFTPNTATLGNRASTCEFWGDTNIEYIVLCVRYRYGQ